MIGAGVFWWLVGPNQVVEEEVICWFYGHKHLRCSKLPGIEQIPVSSCFWLNMDSKQLLHTPIGDELTSGMLSI